MWPLIAAVVGGGLAFWGQERANAANARAAREQMDFQEKMANSSWQRGTADMQAAGLNPMLAYSQGGAGTPGGSSYTNQNSALSAASQIADIQLKGKQLEQMDAQTKSVQSDTAVKNLQWTIDNMRRGDAQRLQEFMQYVDKDGKPVYDNAGQKTGAMPYAIWLMQQQAISQLRQSNSASEASEASAQLMRYDFGRARRESEMYNSRAGQFIPWVTSAGKAAKTLNDFRSLIQR